MSKTTTSLRGTSIGTPTKIAHPISNGYTSLKASLSISSWSYMDHHEQQHKKEREEEEEEQEKRSKLMGHVRCQF